MTLNIIITLNFLINLIIIITRNLTNMSIINNNNLYVWFFRYFIIKVCLNNLLEEFFR